ncbi:DapH/DapD/GlmU-related protein [Paenibacillus sp. NRS-1760]|uniref:PglD-related sugar-binding protein n=1 Tax=Paenibacillus sp. NRS-1760 TaxID=3233902 RepID=UPI003D2A6D66
MSNVIIYGSQQFAQYVRDLVIECGHSFVGFIDDFNDQGENILGSFNKVKETFKKEDYDIVIAIGYSDLKTRWDVYERVVESGYKVISLIHPKANIHKSSIIGNGTIISIGAILDYNTKVGEVTFIWPGVIVNHDSNIGSNCFLSPQVNICGFVNIGDHCFVGASAVVVNGNNIPDNSFVKAGVVYHRKGGTE